MLERKSAVSLDLDGVIFRRTPAQQAVLQPWKYNSPLILNTPLAQVDRNPADRQHLSIGEQLELKTHPHRRINLPMADTIKGLDVDLLIGNTGRPNHPDMINITEKGLREGGINVAYINFKPEGVSSDESKYWGLVELQEMGYTDIVHYDDNARTVRRLAGALPDMRFVIVQDVTSSIIFSRKEMGKHANVARIAVRRNGDIGTTHISANFGRLPHIKAARPSSPNQPI